MVSFKSDLFLTINSFHENYLEKVHSLFINENILNELSIESAENVVKYIKEYKNLINSAGLMIDKINNIKNAEDLNEKIERELMVKMVPIMCVYRTLLTEKYSNNSSAGITGITGINEQD